MTTSRTESRRPSWILITIIGALVAFMFGPQAPLGGFWGVEPDPDISGGLLGAFIGYSAIEAVGFGFGIAWLVLARRRASTAVWLAVAWTFVSWWPHGSLHQAIGEGNPTALVRLEFGFHATMLIAAAVIANDVLRRARTAGG